MKRVMGYVAILVGFVLIASLRIPALFEKLSFLPKIILDSVLYIGLGCFVLGVVLLVIFRGTSSHNGIREVPIYKGNRVIGYRRN